MTTGKPRLRIGLIGTGFMGKAHVFGFAAAQRVFDLPFELELHMVADRDEVLAAAAARTLGFARSSGDWRSLVADPEIDLIDITAPNAFHREMRSRLSLPASMSIARSPWHRRWRRRARWPMRPLLQRSRRRSASTISAIRCSGWRGR